MLLINRGFHTLGIYIDLFIFILKSPMSKETMQKASGTSPLIKILELEKIPVCVKEVVYIKINILLFISGT